MISRRRRGDANAPPTEQEIEVLITRAATLLDELHATFDEIRHVLHDEEES